MASLFDTLLHTAELLRVFKSGTAESGSTTTLVDTQRQEQDNFWNGGTLWMITGENASSSRKVSDFVKSSGNVTVEALGYAVADGDVYGISNNAFPREALVAAVNAALREIGPIPRYDILTPDEDGKETYLVNGVFDIARIETTTESEEPYNWTVSYYWKEINNRIVFDKTIAFTKMRITHHANHDSVQDDDDYVSDYIHPERLAWTAAYYAILNRMGGTQQNEAWLETWLAEAKEQKLVLANRFPVRQMARDPHLSNI